MKSASVETKAPSPLGERQKFSRRDFLAAAGAATLVFSLRTSATGASNEIAIESPGGNLLLRLWIGSGGQPWFRISYRGIKVIEPSMLMMTIDGRNLCQETTISKVVRYRLDERYETR